MHTRVVRFPRFAEKISMEKSLCVFFVVCAISTTLCGRWEPIKHNLYCIKKQQQQKKLCILFGMHRKANIIIGGERSVDMLFFYWNKQNRSTLFRLALLVWCDFLWILHAVCWALRLLLFYYLILPDFLFCWWCMHKKPLHLLLLCLFIFFAYTCAVHTQRSVLYIYIFGYSHSSLILFLL